MSVEIYSGTAWIAHGHAEVFATVESFALLDVPIQTVLAGMPDSARITIGVANPPLFDGDIPDAPTVGSTFVIDDLSFVYSPTSVSAEADLPSVFALEQNYPNPFNPTTTIEYSLPKDSQIRLEVFDAIGAHVVTLVDARMDAGVHSSQFDATALPSGVYLYRLTTGSSVSAKRMILMK